MTTPPGARIFLVDDHPAVLDGLAMLLSQDRHVICGVAASRAEALERIGGLEADLALVDLALCGESGLDLLPKLSALGVPVLVYSMHEDGVTVRRAMERGAIGYVTKRETSAVLLEAVHAVRNSVPFLSPRASASAYEAMKADGAENAFDPLSEREQQIVNLMAEGESNAEIAAALGVSLRTVESYFARIIAKLSLDGMKALRKYVMQQRRQV